MAREYDTQLIESVGVRRRRLRDALLFGADRARHSMDEYLGKLFTGIALAAVICAGCVGWAFLDRELAKEKEKQQPTPSAVTSTSSPTPTQTGLLPTPTTSGGATSGPTTGSPAAG